MGARSGNSRVTLRDVVIFDGPRVELEERVIFETPRVADVVSPVHARLAPFLANARPANALNPGDRRQLDSATGFVERVRAGVGAAVAMEIAREEMAGKGAGVAGPIVQAKLAWAMMGAMSDVRRSFPSTAVSRSATSAESVEQAKSLAQSLAKRAYSASGHALVAARVRLSALAKFASGATVRPAGKPSEGILFAAAKPLALVAAAALVTFTMTSESGAQSRDTKVRVQPSQSQADALWMSASGITINEPNMSFFGSAPAKAAPQQQRANPVPSGVVEVKPPAPAKVEVVKPYKEKLIHVASPGFKELAAMVATTNLEDLEAGRAVVAELEAKGSACVKAGVAGKVCEFEKAGVSMNFSTGNFYAVLAPMVGLTTHNRAVAQETASGLRILDSQALVYAKEFNESRVVELARRTGELPAEEEEEDIGVTTPRR